MSGSAASPQTVRNILAPFGALRPQPNSDWSGDRVLHPALARFYAEVGPYGEVGPRGPDGLTVATLGNPFWLPPLCRLWDLQAGYRWDGRSGQRIADWRDEWLVVADQGGDPFILDGTSGSILHDQHGGGTWQPVPMFADIFVMAMVMGTIGTLHEEAGHELYDADFEVRPAWRTDLRVRLAPLVGGAESDLVATRLDW